MPSSPERETSSKSRDCTSVDDVFEHFKSYFDKNWVETLSSGLISQTSTETQKLGTVSEAEKLKFAGNKGQFLFNSELSGSLDEALNFLASKNIEKAEQKITDLSNLSPQTPSEDYQTCG